MVAAAARAPGGSAEHRCRGARRCRLRPARLLRLGHRDANVRRPGRPGRAARELPHHLAVLADPRVPADRPEPSPQRHGAGRRAGRRVPRLLGQAAAGERLPVRDPARQRLRDLCRGQVAPVPRERDQHGSLACHLAAGPRVRPLVRLSRRRDTPVRPRALSRQPRGPAARVHRGRLPPDRGSGRPRDRVPLGPAGGRGRPGQAVLPVLRHRRVPLTAPAPRALARALPRPVQPRLGRVAGADLRPPARGRPLPRVGRALQATRLGSCLGQPGRPGTGGRGALHGMLRRLPVPRRRAGRPGARVHRGPGRGGQHDRRGGLRQRRKLRGRRHRVDQRRTAAEHGPGRHAGDVRAAG